MIQKLQITLLTAVLFVALVITVSPVYSQVGDNTQLSLAWHEASDFVFTRGYIITAGGTLRDQVDIDQDGKGELLSYEQDSGQHIVSLFEASSDNTLSVIWQFQFGGSTGQLGIAGNERGIMVTDIDHDGFQEIVIIVDSDHPDSTNGFAAGFIFEWDGTDNGIPSTPTATFDPPRNAAGRVALENNSLSMDIDNDGEVELILTYRGGGGKLLSIIQLTATNAELAAGNVTMTVEFNEDFTLTAQSTAADTTLFQAQNTGFGITDVDKDGLKEIIMWDDNTGFVRVYEANGSATKPTFTFVAQWQPEPNNWVAGATVKSQVPQADFDKDGVRELYLSDTKGNSWIVTPKGVVDEMFDNDNWTRLHDWKVGNTFNDSGENRGNLIGDVDRDGKPDIYLAGNNFASILDIEYDGGPVTNGDSYSYFVTAINTNNDVTNGTFARPSNLQLVDMDGDGHLEILAIVPWSGNNPIDNLLGLYLFEYNNTSPVAVGVDDGSLGSQLPKTLSLRQNYPNPFNPITNIMYDVPASASVSLRIYDMLGRSVITLVNEQQSAGSYNVEWNGKNSSGIQVTSGIYFYRLEAGQSATTKKMLLLR